MSAAKQVPVRVDGEYVDVWVAKDGGVTWRAWAQFRGHHIVAKGASQSDATNNWQQQADYKSKE